MTAELAVLNKSAVALAADSKVTIGPDGSEKTYDTANKLFTLSKFHPVGIMIYGNADLMRHPWETMIKTYREDRGRRCCDRIEDYAADFIEYVRDYSFESDLHDDNVYSIATSLFKQISIEFTRVIFRDRTSIAKGPKSVLTKIVAERKAVLSADKTLLSCSEKDILNRYGKELADRAKAAFPFPLDQDMANRLASLAAQSMVSERFSFLHTGVVFAGFGDKQVFPSLREYYVDGMIMGELKVRREEASDTDIHPINETSAIIPFAVRDMADRFMDGIDRNYQRWIDRTVRGLFEQNCLSIIEKYVTAPPPQKRAIKAAVSKAVSRNLEQFRSREARYRQRRFTSPVMDMVDVLPKEELAHLAESLINLTSLRRRVTMDVETVGGPIDVAVISRGDGFIWIKRKHYFQAELNRSFILNYLRSGDDGGIDGKSETGGEAITPTRSSGSC